MFPKMLILLHFFVFSVFIFSQISCDDDDFYNRYYENFYKDRDSDRDSYERDSDREYERDPDREYERDSDREYERDPDREYEHDSDREYERDSDPEYERDPDREYERDPEHEYERDSDRDNEIEEKILKLRSDQRKQQWLLMEMQSLEAPLVEAMRSGDVNATQELVEKIKYIWPDLVDATLDVLEAQANEWTEEGIAYQEDLKNSFTRLLYIGGERYCPLSNETYFMDECRPIGEVGEFCPENMKLVDGPDNIGYCGCSILGYLKSQETGLCYASNSQGPCEFGQWFVFDDEYDFPICKDAPIGCPTDGNHVYWSPDSDSEDKQCWKIGTQGPCESDEELKSIWDADDGERKVSCTNKLAAFYFGAKAPLRRNAPCQTRRNENSNCRTAFNG